MLRINKLVKSFGGILATDNLTFKVEPGELHAVIGPNGAGKTTLIEQITGEIEPDSGSIIFDGNDISEVPVHLRSAYGLARSFQITNIFMDMTVWDNVALAVQAHAGHSFHFWKNASKEQILREPAFEYLQQVGLEKRADDVAGTFLMVNIVSWKLQWPWRQGPKCCCLMNQWQGWGLKNPKPWLKYCRD